MDNEVSKIVIHAFITSVDCPTCEAPQTGFLNDPRGGDFICDECKKPFHVPADAEIDFG